jgi:hypothetical protein
MLRITFWDFIWVSSENFEGHSHHTSHCWQICASSAEWEVEGKLCCYMSAPSGEPLGRLSCLLLGIITHVKLGFVVVTLKPNNSHLSRVALIIVPNRRQVHSCEEHVLLSFLSFFLSSLYSIHRLLDIKAMLHHCKHFKSKGNSNMTSYHDMTRT